MKINLHFLSFRLLSLFGFVMACLPLQAQFDLSVTVLDASVNTSCTDLFSGPDLLWEINIENQGFETYPQQGFCFNSLPNTQYTTSFSCAEDVSDNIEVCFRVFENDAILGPPLGCAIVRSCEATFCQNFPVPTPGVRDTLQISIPAGMDSEGTASFEVFLDAPIATNDLPCDAIDLGTIGFGQFVGDTTGAVIYGNHCATLNGEVNINTLGGFFSNRTVWFRFTTGPDVSGLLYFDLLNTADFADSIDLKLAILTADDCNSPFNLIASRFDNSSLDIRHSLVCPAPNQEYYILVDGFNFEGREELYEGNFRLQVTDLGVQEGGDFRCDAEDLGLVPEGGSVSTSGLRANWCAGDSGDPFTPAFVSQHSVWFQFTAPASGHVLIELESSEVSPIGGQLALYRSINNSCSGFFAHQLSAFDTEELDQSMEVSCLYEGRPYWILVDGSGSAARGAFSLTVSDAGDITPITVIDTTICAGEVLQVGGITHDQSGMYRDTINIQAGCDSVVISNLTVLPPVSVSLTEIQIAVGENNANGITEAIASGGSGSGYTYSWCTGETTPTASALNGNSLCCLTVSDDMGCSWDSCFTVPFSNAIFPGFTTDTLDCFGDSDGSISFFASNGLPPYTYNISQQSGTIVQNGQLTQDSVPVAIENLPAGFYEVFITDSFLDTTFVIEVVQPTALQINELVQIDASCFEACDGSLSVMVLGGTPPYAYNWQNQSSTDSIISNLCAGAYFLTVTDANGCTEAFSGTVEQPLEFLAQATLTQAVSCFDGSDGIVSVSVQHGTAATYLWSNGDMTQSPTGLNAGSYQVTVENTDGCIAFSSIDVPQPAAPLEVSIAPLAAISCPGDADGALQSIVSGPSNGVQYNWSSGSNTPTANGLATGSYTLEVTNAAGCVATADFFLGEPEPLEAFFSIKDITCIDPENGGQITVDSVRGGTPPLLYSMDGGALQSNTSFTNLTTGNYIIEVEDAAGCQTANNLSVAPPPEIVADLGDDILMPMGDSVELVTITNSDFPVFTWMPADTSGSNGTRWVSPARTTTYQVQVLDTVSLCTATAQVTITVDRTRRIYLPSAFSPNDDGINDSFYIFSDQGARQVVSFRIFSRGGQMVFEDQGALPNDASRGWDGRMNGQTLQPGVFVYVAEVEFADGSIEIYEGDVLLMR